MYLIFDKVHKFIEEENGSKSLVFDSTDEHKEVFKEKTELWDVTKNEMETINGGKVGQYRKGFMKTKFDSYDNLPSNKIKWSFQQWQWLLDLLLKKMINWIHKFI